MFLYRSVYESGEAEYIIEKSRFIAHVSPAETPEEARLFIAGIKEKYKDATHNVPAFVCGAGSEHQWASDDGEPQGTSGMPVLKLITAGELTNVAIVITRYFGGIKLGTGGLAAAYKKGVVQVLKECTIVPYRQTDKYMLIFGFSESRLVEYLIEKNGFCVTKKDFGSDVRWTLALTAEEAETLSGLIRDKGVTLRRQQS